MGSFTVTVLLVTLIISGSSVAEPLAVLTVSWVLLTVSWVVLIEKGSWIIIDSVLSHSESVTSHTNTEKVSRVLLTM